MNENAATGLICLATLALIILVGGYYYRKEMKNAKRLREKGKNIYKS